MDRIRNSLDIVQGIFETDKNSFDFALIEIKKRREELTPLFNECCQKGISMKELSNDLNDEWNEIILTIEKHNG